MLARQFNVSFVFDIDGTLTASRQQMTDHDAELFRSIMAGQRYYFVTGSDYKKILEQLPQDIVEGAHITFACLGNEKWTKGKLVDKNQDIIFDHKLIKFLEDIINNNSMFFKDRYGNHIENRGTMLNFSVCGRDIPVEKRQEYIEWDKAHQERNNIIKVLESNFPMYNYSAGGQISIDITDPAQNKAQVVTYLRQTVRNSDKIAFFGDRFESTGNDRPLMEALKIDNLLSHNRQSQFFPVTSVKHTFEILKQFSRF